MITKELADYIEAAKAAGQNTEQIRATLLGVGWQESDVASALQDSSVSAPVSAFATTPAPVVTPVVSPVINSTQESVLGGQSVYSLTAGVSSPRHGVESVSVSPSTPYVEQSVYPAFRAPASWSLPVSSGPAPAIGAKLSVTPVTAPSGKHSVAVVAAIVTGIAVLLAGTAFAVFMLWPADPNKVLAEAFVNSKDIASVATSLTGMLEITGGGVDTLPGAEAGKPLRVTSEIDGNAEVVASMAKVDMTVQITLGEDGANSMGVKFGMRVIGDTVYLKVIQLSPTVSMFLPTLDPYLNKWILVNPKKLPEILSSDMNIDIKTDVDFMDQKKNNILAKKVAVLLAEYKPIFVSKELPNEKVGKMDTYHYELSIDKEALQKFLVRIAQEIIRAYQDDPQMSQRAVKEAEADIDEAFSGNAFDALLKNTSLEIWISKKERFVMRMKAEGSFGSKIFSSAKTTSSSFVAGDSVTKVAFFLDYTLTDQNKPMNIIAPSSSIPIEDIISELFGEKATNAAIKKSLNSIPAHAKNFFDTHNGSYGSILYTNKAGRCPQNGGTTFFYQSVDIRNTLADIMRNNGGQTLTCATGEASGSSFKGKGGATQSYAVSSLLVAGKGVSYCVDSAGAGVQGVAILQGGVAKCSPESAVVSPVLP